MGPSVKASELEGRGAGRNMVRGEEEVRTSYMAILVRGRSFQYVNLGSLLAFGKIGEIRLFLTCPYSMLL